MIVDFQYRQYDYNNPEKIVRIMGEVGAQPKWLKPGELAILTGNPDFPMAVIQKSRILGAKNVEVKTGNRRFKVQSKDKTYEVVLNAGRFTCNCVGFGFRHYCKHVAAVENKLQKN